jgi:hypothetical protein
MNSRVSALCFIMLTNCACQSASAPEVVGKPGGDAALNPSSRSTITMSAAPVLPAKLELTYLKRCKDDLQPRRFSISGETGTFTIVDEHGEAARGSVSTGEVAQFLEVLRKARFDKMMTHPSHDHTACAFEISAGYDGVGNTVTDSDTSRVEASWAAGWNSVKAAVEAVMATHL